LDRASIVPLSQRLCPRLRERILSRRVGKGATLERGAQVPVEYVEGVCHPARYKYCHDLRRQRSQAGEPDCAVPALSGTELDASEQR
jgi:hypothetical protein